MKADVRATQEAIEKEKIVLDKLGKARKIIEHIGEIGDAVGDVREPYAYADSRSSPVADSSSHQGSDDSPEYVLQGTRLSPIHDISSNVA